MHQDALSPLQDGPSERLGLASEQLRKLSKAVQPACSKMGGRAANSKSGGRAACSKMGGRARLFQDGRSSLPVSNVA